MVFPIQFFGMADVTRILSQIDSGDQHAADTLLPLVYDELRKLAATRLVHEKPGQTLGATALVHEAYLRLVGPADRTEQQWKGRGYFFAAAAEAMRRLLVEQARRKSRLRHGGGRQRIDLDSQLFMSDGGDDRLIALHDALARLAADEPQAASVVNLRYFAGLTIEETATAMNLSVRTVNRHWTFARAWLYQQLSDAPG
jgi:RNA polymerase sigma factor (TIGR02999 family)